MSQNNLREYPDHLDPFTSKSRLGSIRKSFRKAFRSFTGKDKQKPDKYLDTRHTRHTIQPQELAIQKPVIQEPTEIILPLPLPRSRFKERLEKTETLKRESKDKHWYEEYTGENPFDNNQANRIENTPNGKYIENHPIPAARSKQRRRKTRAPLPPGRTYGGGQCLSVPADAGSKWSLTSTDTDISSTCYSEVESEYTEANLERNEEIMQITREIAKFTDDSNNNVTFNHAVSIKIEDVDAGDKKKLTEEEIESNHQETQVDVNKNISSEDDDVTVKMKMNGEAINLNTNVKDISEHAQIPNGDITAEAIETETLLEKSDQNKLSNGCVKNIEEMDSIENEKTDENGCEKIIRTDLPTTPKRIRVKIIDNQEVVLRHSEIEDSEDDYPESRFSIQQKIQHFEDTIRSSSPTKVRRTVLTKEKLLGTD